MAGEGERRVSGDASSGMLLCPCFLCFSSPMPAGLGRSAGWITSDDRGDGLVNI